MRAANAVAPNLPPPPGERRPVSKAKPLYQWKYRRCRRGAPPCRHADCRSQWRFLHFRASAPPRNLGGADVWRIDRLLTQNIYRNGCMVILDGPNHYHYRLADPVTFTSRHTAVHSHSECFGGHCGPPRTHCAHHSLRQCWVSASCLRAVPEKYRWNVSAIYRYIDDGVDSNGNPSLVILSRNKLWRRNGSMRNKYREITRPPTHELTS